MIAGMISVIVPIYNAEAFLENCIRSILAQSYVNIEVILVNDGSTDGSGAICDAFADSDNRVRIIHKPNGGESSARNAGLDSAQGEFVALVDHDDVIDSDMYERLHERITKTGADICICGYELIFTKYKRSIRVPNDEKLNIEQFFDAYLNDFEKFNLIFPMPWNKLFRADLLSGCGSTETSKAIRFPEWLSVAGDLWFNADVVSIVKNGIVFADIKPYNFLAANNPYSGSKRDIVENSIKAFEHLTEIMLSVLPHRVQEIERILVLQSCLYTTNEVHKAIIYNRDVTITLKWSTVSTIVKSPVSLPEKISAVLLFLLPRPIYRIVFMLYSRVILR